MKRHRIAIIGLGMAVTPHAKSLIDLSERVEVTAAYSRTEDRRRAFVERFPAFPTTGDLSSILKDRSIDSVLVLTPPDSHLQIVEQCAAAGKHILLEKPLEISLERSEALVAACRSAGVRLGVVLQHRHRTSGLRLREILRSGKLGEIIGASVFIPCWRPQIGYYDQPGRGDKNRDGGGVLLTQGIHSLDLLLSLVAPPVEVSGYAQTSPVHQMETEDLVAAAVRYENGAIGVVEATTAAYPGFAEVFRILGEHGTALITGSELQVAYHDGDTETVSSESGKGGTGADPMDFPNDHHRAVLVDFLDSVDADRDPLVSGEEALKVHYFIEAILEASRKKAVVSVSSVCNPPSSQVSYPVR